MARSPERAVRITSALVGRPVGVVSAMPALGCLSIALSEFATLGRSAVPSASVRGWLQPDSIEFGP